MPLGCPSCGAPDSVVNGICMNANDDRCREMAEKLRKPLVFPIGHRIRIVKLGIGGDSRSSAKDCPFCGASQKLLQSIVGKLDEKIWHVIRCGECKAEGPSTPTEQGALILWNTRLPGEDAKSADDVSEVRVIHADVYKSLRIMLEPAKTRPDQVDEMLDEWARYFKKTCVGLQAQRDRFNFIVEARTVAWANAGAPKGGISVRAPDEPGVYVYRKISDMVAPVTSIVEEQTND
jgi:Lar family restriction alleviation protein